MRAGVLYGTNDLRVEDMPTPSIGPDDLLVEVTYNGLCGTDATEYGVGQIMVPLVQEHPGSRHRGPTVLGHEFIGTVVDAGASTTGRIGQRVACGAGVSCGRCRWCRAGRTNLCSGYYTLGLSTHGGLAEYAAAPASICVAIPSGCSDADAALAQPLAVGIHAVERARIAPGGTVALLGAGAIGSFILAALGDHDGPVIAFDIDEERLATARILGAVRTELLPRDATPADLRELVPDGADRVFETSGAPGAAERAIAMAARGGTVVLVGLTKTPQALNFADVVLREVTIQTTVAHICDSDLPAALQLLDRMPLAPLLLHGVVPLERAVTDGFQPLVEGLVRGKVLVDPRA